MVFACVGIVVEAIDFPYDHFQYIRARTGRLQLDVVQLVLLCVQRVDLIDAVFDDECMVEIAADYKGAHLCLLVEQVSPVAVIPDVACTAKEVLKKSRRDVDMGGRMCNTLRLLVGEIDDQRHTGLILREVAAVPPIISLVIIELLAMVGCDDDDRIRQSSE